MQNNPKNESIWTSKSSCSEILEPQASVEQPFGGTTLRVKYTNISFTIWELLENEYVIPTRNK
jgi:hypothetical protein